MGGEIFNPKRRYKEFRPRQALRGMKVTGTPTNLATVGLFNNSSGPQLLVVRDLTINGPASDTVNISNVVGQIGSSQGLVHAMVPSQPGNPGLIASIDTATVYPGDYAAALSTIGSFVWNHDLPFAVVEPGFSLVFQDGTAAHGITISLIWEAIATDELDWSW